MKHTITIAIINPPHIRPRLSFSGSPMQVAMKYRRIFGRSDNAVHESGNIVAKLEGITLEEIRHLCPAFCWTRCDRPEDLAGMVRDIKRHGNYIHEIVIPPRRKNSMDATLPSIVWSAYPPPKAAKGVAR